MAGWMPDDEKVDAAGPAEVADDIKAIRDAKTDDEHDAAVDAMKAKYGK